MGTTRSGKTLKKVKDRSESAGQRIQSFLELFGDNDTVLIVVNPDPDSMASALAVKRLLWKHVRRTLIAYAGKIQRLENRAMVELLKIPMTRIDKVVAEAYSRYVLVDSQPYHLEVFERFEYDAIIDHHPKAKKCDARYVDIRPEYRATSTIFIEYLREAGIKPAMRLSTALLYGIKTDTANFKRDAAEQDIIEFRYILQYANMKLLRNIEKSDLTNNDIEYFKTALENRVVGKKGHYSHLGEVSHPDICVQIADFFSRVYEMGWSFVSGVYRGRLIVIIRNDGYRKNAGRVATRAFAAPGSAGGHQGAARAEIPLEVLRQNGIEAQDFILEDFVRKRLKL